MRKKILIGVNVIGGLLVLWAIASYLNIIAHNTTDYNYWSFNLFTLLFN